MNDLSVIIPYSYDHADRLRNLQVCLSYWHHYFPQVKVLVGEINTNTCEIAVKLNYNGIMHRTRAINELTRLAGTTYCVNWDVDVLVRPEQITKMHELLKSGIDFVYPYDGCFYWCDRGIVDHWWKHKDLSYYDNHKFRRVGASVNDRNSYGGAVGYNVKAFFRAGGENENFVSYGPEDQERWKRFNIMGTVARVSGPIYHTWHERGINSGERHAHGKSNVEYWRKLQRMTGEQIKEHINTFTWLK